MTPFARAMAEIDALHAEDPSRIEVDGASVPAELHYARRMTAALARLCPEATEALCLAVRAQHLARWEVPRASYPEGTAGYRAWRTAQAARHAARAAAILEAAGCDAALVARVQHLVQKRDLRSDPETQALEDAACLVFLEDHLAELTRGREEAQVISILQKTWRKMSEPARALALALPLAPEARALVGRAVGG